MWFPWLLWATSTLCLKAPLSVLIDLWGAFGVCVCVCVGVYVCAWEGALRNQMARINKLTIYFGVEWHFVERGDTCLNDLEYATRE